MKGENDRRTSAAIIATQLIEPPSTKAVQTLIHFVENTKDNPKTQAIMALGLMGKMASPAIPLLESLTLDRNTGIRNKSKKALAQIRADRLKSEQLSNQDPKP